MKSSKIQLRYTELEFEGGSAKSRKNSIFDLFVLLMFLKLETCLVSEMFTGTFGFEGFN